MGWFKRYLIAGLLVWLPLGVTIYILIFLVTFFDRILLLLPNQLTPEFLLGFKIPGLGIIMSLFAIIITGMFVANFFGSHVMSISEKVLAKIPLVRSIYSAVKQISEAIFVSGSKTFHKVFLIQYPRIGLWTIAFETSDNLGEAQYKTRITDPINLFVPTTPNPTSGFFIVTSREEVVELEIPVDDALKMVISGGVVVPEWKGREEFDNYLINTDKK